MRMDKKSVLPIAGATMAVGAAALGMMMMPRKKKQSAQKPASSAVNTGS